MENEYDNTYIPYGRQAVDEDDIAAVAEVLRSDWLTTGPAVARFEQGVSDFTGAAFGVAVASGTAALHAAMAVLDIQPGDEVLVPALTFIATANCVVYQGGTVVFVDVLPESLLLDPADVKRKITPRTKAVIAMDYAGQPCDYKALRNITKEHGLALVADSCHALGGRYGSQRVGTLADLTVFSFHPLKHITTGEGGMLVTDTEGYAEAARSFRNHGIILDHHQRHSQSTFRYDMQELGYNFRISDIHCALGLSQLGKLSAWLKRRQEMACLYDALCADLLGVFPLHCRDSTGHAYHLYVVRLDGGIDRQAVFQYMRHNQIGVNVHYQPVYQHGYYRSLGYADGLCPVAEEAYDRILSLPMYIGLTDEQIRRVVMTLRQAIEVAA